MIDVHCAGGCGLVAVEDADILAEHDGEPLAIQEGYADVPAGSEMLEVRFAGGTDAQWTIGRVGNS